MIRLLKVLLPTLSVLLMSVVQFHHHDSDGHVCSPVVEWFLGAFDDGHESHRHSEESECGHCVLQPDPADDAGKSMAFTLPSVHIVDYIVEPTASFSDLRQPLLYVAASRLIIGEQSFERGAISRRGPPMA